MTRNASIFYSFGSSAGDWIHADSITNYLYYVGGTPEIVLELPPPHKLETATFEMHHDVPWLSRSSALDSVNLLSRIGEDNLERFGFKLAQNCGKKHWNLTNTVFEKVLNPLTIVDYRANYGFYCSDFEDEVFVRIRVESLSDDSNSLHSVWRADSMARVDRVLVDFSFSMLHDVFDLLCSLISPCVEGLQLHQGAKYHTYDEFVFTLLWSFLEADVCTPITVACCGDFGDSCSVLQKNITFQVFTCTSTKTKQVEMMILSLNSADVFHKLVYNKQAFWRNKSIVQAAVREIRWTSKNPKICINLASNKQA